MKWRVYLKETILRRTGYGVRNRDLKKNIDFVLILYLKSIKAVSAAIWFRWLMRLKYNPFRPFRKASWLEVIFLRFWNIGYFKSGILGDVFSFYLCSQRSLLIDIFTIISIIFLLGLLIPLYYNLGWRNIESWGLPVRLYISIKSPSIIRNRRRWSKSISRWSTS